jgi:hypothetical protein
MRRRCRGGVRLPGPNLLPVRSSLQTKRITEVTRAPALSCAETDEVVSMVEKMVGPNGFEPSTSSVSIPSTNCTGATTSDSKRQQRAVFMQVSRMFAALHLCAKRYGARRSDMGRDGQVTTQVTTQGASQISARGNPF